MSVLSWPTVTSAHAWAWGWGRQQHSEVHVDTSTKVDSGSEKVKTVKVLMENSFENVDCEEPQTYGVELSLAGKDWSQQMFSKL